MRAAASAAESAATAPQDETRMQTGTRHAQAYSDVPVLHGSAVLATLQIAG